MPDVPGAIERFFVWATWLLDQARQWWLTYGPRLAEIWHEGPLSKRALLLAIAAGLGLAALVLGRKAFRGARRLLGGVANVVMILVAVAPTIIILFLAVVGGLWLATSF